MTGKPEPGINWDLATWKGSRLQQHREFHALSFSRKLQLIEEMSDMAAWFGAAAKHPGSPAASREDAPRSSSTGDRGKQKHG
jgi:hypothetical protein